MIPQIAVLVEEDMKKASSRIEAQSFWCTVQRCRDIVEKWRGMTALLAEEHPPEVAGGQPPHQECHGVVSPVHEESTPSVDTDVPDAVLLPHRTVRGDTSAVAG